MDPFRTLPFVLACLALGVAPAAQCEVQTLLPPDSTTSLGTLLAQDGTRFALASLGSIRIYEQVGRTAYLEQALAFPELDGQTYIRTLVLDGDTLAFGTYTSSPALKSVRVLERQAGGWVEVLRLTFPSNDADFGSALALDGDRLAIGAPYEAPSGTTSVGAVHLFERRAGVWTPVETLTSPSPQLGERFGFALDLEGDRLAVAAPLFFSHQQNAYVLDHTASGWQASTLTPSGAGTGVLGKAIDLRGDEVLVSDPSAVGGGRAWVFERSGTSWIQTGELTQPGPGIVFGFADSVALNGDGTIALLASSSDGPSIGSGAVHVFEKRAGVWERGEALVPLRSSANTRFGSGVTCAGELAVITASGFATTVSLDETLCRTLFGRPDTVSLTSGGRHTLRLNPGAEFAGKRFLLLGSATGFDPGFTLLGQRVPLVPDGYFQLGLPRRRRPPFVNNFGVLGAAPPQAEVTIDVPPGTDLALAGLTLYHAFVVLDRGVVHVSNARSLTLVP